MQGFCDLSRTAQKKLRYLGFRCLFMFIMLFSFIPTAIHSIILFYYAHEAEKATATSSSAATVAIMSSKNARATIAIATLLFMATISATEGFVQSIFRRRPNPAPIPLEELFLVDPLAILEQNPLAGGEFSSDISLAKVDWKETNESHMIKIDVPGIKREDIKVEYENDVLTVRGEQKKEKVEKTDVWHREERMSGTFIRRFRLPDANMQEVKAELKDGVLTLTVPKMEKKQIDGPKEIPLQECKEEPDSQACKA